MRGPSQALRPPTDLDRSAERERGQVASTAQPPAVHVALSTEGPLHPAGVTRRAVLSESCREEEVPNVLRW